MSVPGGNDKTVPDTGVEPSTVSTWTKGELAATWPDIAPPLDLVTDISTERSAPDVAQEIESRRESRIEALNSQAFMIIVRPTMAAILLEASMR
jgi:hypothetical protein